MPSCEGPLFQNNIRTLQEPSRASPPSNQRCLLLPACPPRPLLLPQPDPQHQQSAFLGSLAATSHPSKVSNNLKMAPFLPPPSPTPGQLYPTLSCPVAPLRDSRVLSVFLKRSKQFVVTCSPATNQHVLLTQVSLRLP
jgi:hypothetical protein